MLLLIHSYEFSVSSQTHLGPPGGQHEVGVNIVLSKLLGHVKSERAVGVIDVPLVQVRQDGMSIVQLLEFLCCLRILWVLIGVIAQS